MRNTRAFKEAVADTLADLARRGVTLRPGTVADTIERNIRAVAAQLEIQERSAWRYFDPSGLAASIAQQRQAAEDSSAPGQVGRAPMPPVDNPELALILGGVPDALEESGGDLYSVIVSVAVNAWKPQPTVGRTATRSQRVTADAPKRPSLLTSRLHSCADRQLPPAP
ncbi:hypothetical protein ACFWWA_38590 [Streptomyces goshikiensis]|uniref:hypothetical protein n=1 Tax=Streptomyces goshikiensis TaxID=1942 RepID=UPI00366177D0